MVPLDALVGYRKTGFIHQEVGTARIIGPDDNTPKRHPADQFPKSFEHSPRAARKLYNILRTHWELTRGARGMAREPSWWSANRWRVTTASQ